MKIPIINGIYTDEKSEFRSSYPRNMIPVPGQNGINAGYLRPADGIVELTTGPGIDRGGINWNGACYRVMGESLVKILEDGSVTTLGTVAGADQVTIDYSFDYLSISTGKYFYLFDGYWLQQVLDADLGDAVDHIWVDGYFMTTDGEYLIVTELNDPFTVLTTKYGSSEADPDQVKAILKLHNEPYALNRYTIEAFDNVGGNGFPFQRIDGAQVQRGTVGTHTCCIFLENIAFIGGGRNESISVWLASSGRTIKISTREVDQALSEYSESRLAECLVESIVDDGHEFLYIHLPDYTLVYDGASSKSLEQPVWFRLTTGILPGQYRAKNFVRCYNKWLVGDPQSSSIGYLSDTTHSHWGDLVDWEFNTSIVYNEGRGAIFHELELVCLSGRMSLGVDSRVATQYSIDGESWSTPKYVSAGTRGQRNKRLVWINQGGMKNWRIQKFFGTSDANISVARLEARIESLGV